MKKNKLTVIIPFLNEGVEIANTVKSIRETAGRNVDVLLVNDASFDDFPYEDIVIEYGTFYFKNLDRKGVAESRNIGVSLIKTPYFILIDGHMRFYNDNWWNKIINYLDSDDRAVYSGKCLDLDIQGKIKSVDQKSFGAFLNINNCIPSQLLEPTWITIDHNSNCLSPEIPCILGASYALSVRYWMHIGGLEGLRYYGNDEAYLSLKVWLEGGRCILMKDVEVGHIFREEAPYRMFSGDRVYNKIFISRLLLPEVYGQNIETILQKVYPVEYSLASAVLRKNCGKIEKLKCQYDKIFIKDFDSFIYLNKNEDYHVSFDSKLRNRLRELMIYMSSPTDMIGLMTGELGEIIFAYEYAYKQNNIFYKKQADEKMNSFLVKAEKVISHYNIKTGTAGLGLGLKYLVDKGYIDFDWKKFMTRIESPMYKYMLEQMNTGNMGLIDGASGVALYFFEMGVCVINQTFLVAIERYLEKEDCSVNNDILDVLSFLLFVNEKKPELNLIHLLERIVCKIQPTISIPLLSFYSGDLRKLYLVYKASQVIGNQYLMNYCFECVLESSKRKDVITEEVNDASIYSGSAGVALIYFLLNKEKKSDQLVSAYHFWLDDISYKVNNLNTEYFLSSKYPQYNRGLLFGAAGIGLSLLAIMTEDIPSWKTWIGL